MRAAIYRLTNFLTFGTNTFLLLVLTSMHSKLSIKYVTGAAGFVHKTSQSYHVKSQDIEKLKISKSLNCKRELQSAFKSELHTGTYLFYLFVHASPQVLCPYAARNSLLTFQSIRLSPHILIFLTNNITKDIRIQIFHVKPQALVFSSAVCQCYIL